MIYFSSAIPDYRTFKNINCQKGNNVDNECALRDTLRSWLTRDFIKQVT